MSDWDTFEGNPQGQYNPGSQYGEGQANEGAYSGDAFQGNQNEGTYSGDPFDGDQFNGGTYFDPNAMPNQNDMQKPNNGNGMAIASLVLGIIGIVTCCCSPLLELVLGILAVVFGIKGRQHEDGNSMATAGLVLGIIAIVLAVANGVLSFVISFVFGITSEDLLNSYYYY